MRGRVGGSGGVPKGAPPQHLLPAQRLNGEVSQLRRSLQRAETEAKVLWEEVRGQEPKVDAARVQERILMRQEVRPRGAGPGVATRRPQVVGRHHFPPCFHLRWTNCACCSWRRWMRTHSSRTSTWSRYWELPGVPAAPIPSPPPYTCPLIPPRLISLPFNASSQIQGLELRLQQSQKLLKAYEETQEKMKKVS